MPTTVVSVHKLRKFLIYCRFNTFICKRVNGKTSQMHIEKIRFRNFRRLKNVLVDFASDISIFVGANNSGKTSASHALQLFASASKERFAVHDFSVDTWEQMNAFGEGQDGSSLPKISLDIWLNVNENDLHRVIDLLPNLDWTGSTVGIRIEFSPIDESETYNNFRTAYSRTRTANNRAAIEEGYNPLPRNMVDYLSDNIRKEYDLKYFVLDRSKFSNTFEEDIGYEPLPLPSDSKRVGKHVVNSLIRIDCLHAQRHLSDSSGGVRAEDLSRCLSRFYSHNLEKKENDFATLKALADAESMLNEHLKRVFGPTLDKLAELGYPGLANPKLVIKSTLNPASIMSTTDGTKVHYSLDNHNSGNDLMTLPDRYNGLGFKNLIYMVVELLDIHNQWMDIEEDRPPLHLIFIEEPEAHLHAQLQQVFIRKVLDILRIEGVDQGFYTSQMVVTTHSPHILYERGFKPIRYFRRHIDGNSHTSEVLNLSKFYNSTEPMIRDFLERYLKLTHCDLFFADAALLVEGNVERLLLPQMIAKSAPRLRSVCLTILEIGGAFGHRFKTLIDFLGITTLIITDIDSVIENTDEETEADSKSVNDREDRNGIACSVDEPNAVTSNQALIQWLPAIRGIRDLLQASLTQRTQARTSEQALVHVAYQMPISVSWSGATGNFTGRTLEEAFALENLAWSQHIDRKDIGLRIGNAARYDLEQMVDKVYYKVKSSSFNKTDFALGLLSQNPNDWNVPSYIAQGLEWLENQIIPSAAPEAIQEQVETPVS
jgi:predicted ATP-dependent endonuclease of OLD family